MRNLLLLLLILLLAFKSDAQNEWVGQKFKTDVLIGHSEYKSGKQDIRLNVLDAKNPWGYFVVFNADGTFNAYNQVSCGLDCRMKIKGTYTLKENSIEIFTDEIKYYDICITKPSEKKTFSYGTFDISEDDGTFVLNE